MSEKKLTLSIMAAMAAGFTLVILFSKPQSTGGAEGEKERSHAGKKIINRPAPHPGGIPATEEDCEQVTVTRIYDIRSLLVEIPNFPGPQSAENVLAGTDRYITPVFPPAPDDDSSREKMIYTTKDTITNTVDPTSWMPTGTVGLIEGIRGYLLITQTRENHEKIEKLLDMMENATWQNILVRARWVEADADKVNKIFSESKAKKQAPFPITNEQLEKIGAKTIYRGQLCFTNSQSTYITSGPAQSCITGLEPIVSARVSADRPVVGVVQWGPILNMVATLTMDKKSVVTTIKNSISTKNKPEREKTDTPQQIPAPKPTVEISPGGLKMFKFDTQSFSATLKIPLDTPVIVGGMTTPKQEDGKVLYLILEYSADG